MNCLSLEPHGHSHRFGSDVVVICSDKVSMNMVNSRFEREFSSGSACVAQFVKIYLCVNYVKDYRYVNIYAHVEG